MSQAFVVQDPVEALERAQASVPAPPEPESVEQTGLAETTIEHLILKILYFRGELYGQDLSNAVGLKFSVIQDLVEGLKLQHQIVVKRSLGMGNVAAVMALTESGRSRAREHLEANQYSGAAPVPLEQYAEFVRRQKHQDGWLTKKSLAAALSGMVVSEQLLSQVGPAISAANSMLIYGRPGDGKTFLIESLANLEVSPIYLPNAIECQGNIIQLFDPIYHQAIEEPEEEAPIFAVARAPGHDRRWIKCKRPFIVSGGELSLDMLDLRYNNVSKIYEAPFQLKANNGIYLVDDFGRQRATPAEVLNRWIVPMERRVDYLNFLTGGKMTAPFETFLVFSTNLNPSDLGDEAFLRRIQYKLLVRSPDESEFKQIFQRFCEQTGVSYPRGVVERFIERHYRRTGKRFRRCHPRDVLSHALNLIHFEKLPREISDELLDRAFESCFLQEQEDAAQEGASEIAACTL
jgi:predicted ATPase with chaperone activity